MIKESAVLFVGPLVCRSCQIAKPWLLYASAQPVASSLQKYQNRHTNTLLAGSQSRVVCCEHVLIMSSSSSNVVGVHYRVGKKIGEGSFGVIFEGTNLLNNQSVAIKFVSFAYP